MKLLSKPTVEYCEKPINFIISRPGYAISNLPYIFLGLFLLLKKNKSATTNLFGCFAIAIGLASFFYDATYTLLSQLIDLSVMFTFINSLIVLNLLRLHQNINRRNLLSIFVLIFITYILLTFALGGSTGRILFGLSVVALIVTEVMNKVKYRNTYSLSKWTYAFLIFIFGFILWLFDAQQIVCFEWSIFNGRSLFHYCTAGSIYFLEKFYGQFKFS